MTYASSYPCNERIRREEKKEENKDTHRPEFWASLVRRAFTLHRISRTPACPIHHPPLAVAPLSPVNDNRNPPDLVVRRGPPVGLHCSPPPKVRSRRTNKAAPPPESCASSRLDERLVLSCLARLPRHHVHGRDIVGLWGTTMWRRPYDVRQNFTSWFINS
ncbi:hypothetical protein CDEST_04680 [Colletotrichum destructivum]|uniref:Uncharacterized protein n=1 Tax=Colletotrichum destructivum TaxID=34406 RepID=A0AAX4I939_9PEZI|nr:hypothetical protein CDEST_04680 [Colletotrichum destructivum]